MKIIYKPTGRAGEYSRWSASIFRGCSNKCFYCYLFQGFLKNLFGRGCLQLNSCCIIKPKSDSDYDKKIAFTEGCKRAVLIFRHELEPRRGIIRADGGIFFAFTTDPCLSITFRVYEQCAMIALGYDKDVIRYAGKLSVPVTFLTKCTGWIDTTEGQQLLKAGGRNLCIGFTLTGRDDLEPNASSNAERIEAMKRCHEAGVRTFASIEPIIDLDKSLDMIKTTVGFCDVYKIGLLSGKKLSSPITLGALAWFVNRVQTYVGNAAPNARIFWKRSVRNKVAGLVKFSDNVVDEYYNIFADA